MGRTLAPEAEEAIYEADRLVMSAVTVWEAEIKAASGKLRLSVDLVAEAEGRGVQELAVTWQHAVTAARLPLHHHDPFDRMLIAQAEREDLTLVTRDAVFEQYGVALLRA